LGKALSTVARDGASPYSIAAIKFLALSGCRKIEALTLQWSWIDFKHRFANDSIDERRPWVRLAEDFPPLTLTLPRGLVR
ncbi:hypothetical protein ACC754_43250, partial [Rhizobium johnstonii]